MDYVAVSHHVFTSLQTHLTGFFRALLAATGDVVGIACNLGANESTFEIGVDLTRGLRCGASVMDCPRVHFLRAGGEEGIEPKQLVAGMDHPVEPRLGK